MPYRWPDDTVFTHLEFDVEDRWCHLCGSQLTVCDHRHRRLFTLQGPVHAVCKLAHCPKQVCPAHSQTRSPEAEMALAMPWWVLGWDVVCWLGHRRFARHWSVGQIRTELADTYTIRLSADAIERYIQRYQRMVAARQHDPQRVAAAYADVEAVILSIDGLQPEKGHETLYVVRELTRKRVWFAEALVSSTTAEVQRLLAQAREWAERLEKPVRLWMSDKQAAFVRGIAAEFPGVPHRYCANHFLRDVAKPVLAADSHAKVQMRRKVRGLRSIEREVGASQRPAEPSAPEEGDAGAPGAIVQASEPAPAVVLDYCAAVRGILNDDHGGPLHPPGLRMAEALGEVHASLQRNLAAEKGGLRTTVNPRLADYIDRGLTVVQDVQEAVRSHVESLRAIQTTLAPTTGTVAERHVQFQGLQEQFQQSADPVQQHMGRVMASFAPGLFAGGEAEDLPQDNLDLERWFRQPKGHERRIHGHCHAGVRLVQEGPTLLLALDAHVAHPEPFTVVELWPYRSSPAPACQEQALQRRTIMRRARSKKQRLVLLAELEQRYLDGS